MVAQIRVIGIAAIDIVNTRSGSGRSGDRDFVVDRERVNRRIRIARIHLHRRLDCDIDVLTGLGREYAGIDALSVRAGIGFVGEGPALSIVIERHALRTV